MIYKGIQNLLENNSALTTLVGTDSDSDYKIYPISPRLQESPPFIIYNILSQRGNPTKSENSLMDEVMLRISVMAVDLDDTINLFEAVRDAMDEYKNGGTFNGVNINSIDFESLSDEHVEGFGDRGLKVINIDYNIWIAP